MNYLDLVKTHPQLSEQELLLALENVLRIAKHNLPDFTYNSQFHSSVNNIYGATENSHWTSGFWPGILWLCFENSNDALFKYAGQIQVESFALRIQDKIEVDHHDMGFLYTPSCVSSWSLTKNPKAREAALEAADQLISRYQEKGGFIQAWGEKGAADNYRYIIDCLMNVPLLQWAYHETGRKEFRDIASTHTRTTLQHSIRDDGSTYHTYFFDINSGKPLHGSSCQGYRDDSAWARGQAWGVYGLALAYRFEKGQEYLTAFSKVLDFYLSKLPEDLIPYWDLSFVEGDEPRDSSSASIVACGLLEMAQLIQKQEPQQALLYQKLAKAMLKSLIDHYSVNNPGESNGLVLHGTYSKKSPYNTCTEEGVDECVSWGDYFYVEALTRLNLKWASYW